MNSAFTKQTLSLVLAILLSAAIAAGKPAAADDLRGTLVVAVPVSDGLVVCSDKRLFNSNSRTYTDDNVKIRRVGDNALFVATNTVGFYDQRTRTMAFDAFAVVEAYTAKNGLAKGKPFWDGLKREITSKLRAYFAGRSFGEWPESNRASGNLLFNLIFYELRDGTALSHSLKVFYEKKRTPVIYIPDPVTEQVRTPKLSGKGREVMSFLARSPDAASDPAILKFDSSRFDPRNASEAEAVEFAKRLIRLTSTGVPRANVSRASDCAVLSYSTGFRWAAS